MLNLAILNNFNLIKLCIQKFTNQFEENKSDQNKKDRVSENLDLSREK